MEGSGMPMLLRHQWVTQTSPLVLLGVVLFMMFSVHRATASSQVVKWVHLAFSRALQVLRYGCQLPASNPRKH